MHTIVENKEKIFVISGFHPNGDEAKFGYPDWKRKETLGRGRTIPIFHLYHIVDQELTRARFIFQGLKRPLMEGEGANGAKRKLVYTWVPISDFDYDYLKRFEPDGVKQKPPPEGKTFMVIVTPNLKKDKYTTIDYWLERWAWVHSDPQLPDAPINYQTRYDFQLKP